MINQSSKPLIIIGSGLAGSNLAKEWRKLEQNQPLIIITQDDGHFYSKPLLSTALHQAKTPAQLVITDSTTLQTQLNAQFYTYTTVTSIDTVAKTVTIQNDLGEKTLIYQDLVLAIGAEPKPLNLFENIAHHYRVNSLMDYTKFIHEIDEFEEIVIIGSGLVGCEFAHDLSKKDLKIKIVTPDPYPLRGLVPQIVGQALEEALAEKGIQWFTNTAANTIEPKPHQAILSAIGLQPRIRLAKNAGLNTNLGIVVDHYLRTSMNNVYAVGDCAEIVDQCRYFVAPLLQSIRALAHTLHGTSTKVDFPPFPVTLKVSSFPLITYPPLTSIEGDWHFEGSGKDLKGLFYDKAGDLRGYVLTGTKLEDRQLCLKNLKID